LSPLPSRTSNTYHPTIHHHDTTVAHWPEAVPHHTQCPLHIQQPPITITITITITNPRSKPEPQPALVPNQNSSTSPPKSTHSRLHLLPWTKPRPQLATRTVTAPKSCVSSPFLLHETGTSSLTWEKCFCYLCV